MRELKKMIIDILANDYPFAEAVNQVDTAEIRIKGDKVTVIYDNGEVDVFSVVITETLVLDTNSQKS